MGHGHGVNPVPGPTNPGRLSNQGPRHTLAAICVVHPCGGPHWDVCGVSVLNDSASFSGISQGESEMTVETVHTSRAGVLAAVLALDPVSCGKACAEAVSTQCALIEIVGL